MPKEPIDELEELQHRSTAGVAAGILRLAYAIAKGQDGRPEDQDLRQTVLDAMHYADLLGRRRVLLEYGAADDGAELPAQRADPVRAALGAEGPPFAEMIADLLARVPKLAVTAADVARIYSTEHVFAAVFSPAMQVTQAVQKTMARLQQEGVETNLAVKTLEEMTGWSRWYAETVFRTNVTTAYSAGRWKQVSDPVVAEVVPAFRYSAVGDSDTRKNHEAADGLIAGLNDPIWERFTPPLGYNCRCTLELVDRFTLQRMSLLKADGTVQRFTPPNFAQAAPDSERFGNGRPDRRIYGF